MKNPLDEDFKIKNLTHIYIIESPSESDLAAGISEGRALSAKLTDLGISHDYFKIQNKQQFAITITQIIDLLKPKANDLACVYLHFSMHGNNYGVGLTSGEFISWQDIADQLYNIAKSVGVLRIFGNTFFPIALSFSTCYGIEGVAINAFVREDQSLYVYVIGPNVPVTWEDALQAFMTYYENNLHYNEKLPDAVRLMNTAVNLNGVFEVRLGKNMNWEV